MPASNQRDALLRTIEQKRHLKDQRFEGMQRIDPEGGGGQFSLVLKAKDRHSNRDVALKFFDPAKRGDAYRWESFKREVELLPRFLGKSDILQCVCPLTEFQEPFENPAGIELKIDFAFYAVELANCDVSAAIAGNKWSPLERLVCFRSMCRAVQRVHAAFIAHRDLKPSNFLIMDDGTLRLSDFGAARQIPGVAGIATKYTGPPGDLRYVSPEMMAVLHDVDPSFAFKGDFYALGAILFELFTGAVLNLHVLDHHTLSMLNQTMNVVQADQRVQIYNSLVGSLSSARPLPSVGLFGGQTPRSIVGLIDHLFRGLAALDYRRRIFQFEDVFLQIDRCVYVLKHEAAYQRWREMKRLRKTRSLI